MRAGFLMLFGLSLATAARAQERRFCEDDTNCAPVVLAVRFGDPARHEFQSAGVAAGEEFDAWVGLEVLDESVQGWSFGLAHDADRLEILEVTTEGTPFGFFTFAGPAVGDPSPGAVSATLLAILPPPGMLWEVGDHTLARVRYRARSALSVFVPTAIRFVDDLIPNPGSPPAFTNVTIESRSRRPRTVVDGLVWGGSPDDVDQARFSRGDCNGDGRVDLSDVVVCVRHIFLGQLVSFDCPAAVDVTADGQLNTGDPINLIAWLFLGGPALPRPFQSCERGPTSGLGCGESNCEPRGAVP